MPDGARRGQTTLNNAATGQGARGQRTGARSTALYGESAWAFGIHPLCARLGHGQAQPDSQRTRHPAGAATVPALCKLFSVEVG